LAGYFPFFQLERLGDIEQYLARCDGKSRLERQVRRSRFSSSR
jgi:hypothetical protein